MLLSVTMIYIAFKPQNIKILFKYLIIFYLTSFVFGGCAFFLLYYIKPQEILYKNGFLTGTYPIKITFLGATVGFTLVSIAFKVIKNRLNKNDMFCDITIFYQQKSVKVHVIIDSGNLLKEPITQTPVIIVEKEALESMIESKVLKDMEKIMEGTDTNLVDTIGKDYISRFRLIPFSSLGRQNGMLIGFKPDCIILHFDETETKTKNVIIRYLSKNN